MSKYWINVGLDLSVMNKQCCPASMPCPYHLFNLKKKKKKKSANSTLTNKAV